MREFYFHEDGPGGLRTTNRLRAVERTTEDGYTIVAGKRGNDSISLRLESRSWGRAEDVLSAAERVSLAKLLLSDLPLDQIRDALPHDLFTTEWALRTTDNPEPEIIAEPEGGMLATREDAEAGLADLTEAFEDPAAEIVRRETSVWLVG